MSIVICEVCKGSGIVCRSCNQIRHHGYPHHRCVARAKQCPSHTTERVFCDSCGADHLEDWQYGPPKKVLCAACFDRYEALRPSLEAVAWDAFLMALGEAKR